MKKCIALIILVFFSGMIGCVSWSAKEFHELQNKNIRLGWVTIGVQTVGSKDIDDNTAATNSVIASALPILKEIPFDKMNSVIEKKLNVKVDMSEFEKSSKKGFQNDSYIKVENGMTGPFLIWEDPARIEAWKTSDWSKGENWMFISLTTWTSSGQINLSYSVKIFAKGTSGRPYPRVVIQGDENLYTIFSFKKSDDEEIANKTLLFVKEKLPLIIEERLSYL